MKCPECSVEAKSIEAGSSWSSWYCDPCNVFFWEDKRRDEWRHDLEAAERELGEVVQNPSAKGYLQRVRAIQLRIREIKRYLTFSNDRGGN